MKNKIIIGVIIGLVGISILVNGLYDKKNVPEIENEIQSTIEIVDTNTNTTKTTKKSKKAVKTTKKVTKKIITTKKANKSTTQKSTQSGYKLTHYGPDCKGCGGNTSIGYNVKHTIYYNDYQFGKVRVCAMSKSIPLYSIIKIKNYKLGGDITCAVIDRGVGNGVIDLLTESEKKSSQLGIQRNVQIEILRRGR